MAATERIRITREQLYEQVWSTPMRMLASKYGLSDVGLAKVCKKYAVPRPPVGYWAKIEHGKEVEQPELPPTPEGVGETIVFMSRPQEDERATRSTRVFFDAALGELAARVLSGEVVQRVGDDLRGCAPLTRSTREALAASERKPKRDRWGALISQPRYEQPHINVATSKEVRQRSLLLLDSIVKTLMALGCEQHTPKDEWSRCVIFVLRGLRFRLRIRERSKRVPHVLTAEEKRRTEQGHYSFAPKYDYVDTGELYVELLRTEWSGVIFKLKDAKRAGRIEDRIAEIALAVLEGADKELQRSHQQKLAAEREREQRRIAELEAQRRRILEEKWREEQSHRDRLVRLAEDWHAVGSLRVFLAEVQRRLTEQTLTDEDRDLMERWVRWVDRVAQERDPFGLPVGDLPERTHPGIKERERRSQPADGAKDDRQPTREA